MTTFAKCIPCNGEGSTYQCGAGLGGPSQLIHCYACAGSGKAKRKRARTPKRKQRITTVMLRDDPRTLNFLDTKRDKSIAWAFAQYKKTGVQWVEYHAARCNTTDTTNGCSCKPCTLTFGASA